MSSIGFSDMMPNIGVNDTRIKLFVSTDHLANRPTSEKEFMLSLKSMLAVM